MTSDYQTLSAKALYEALRTRRENFITRAEEAAAYTIPGAFPRRGHNQTQTFQPPKSGLGAQAVNSLVNKMTSVLIPTNAQFFRYIPDREASQILKEQNEEVQRETEATFSDIERSVRLEIESQGIRVVAHEAFLHLIISGNALSYFPPKGGMEFFPLNKYVVARDASDNVLAIVIMEKVAMEALTDEQRDACSITFRPPSAPLATAVTEPVGIEVYTKVCLKDGKWAVIQEINDCPVPGTEASYQKDEMPYHPLRWTRVNGEDYGRGICEEYIGSLRIVEYMTKAITEGGMAASRILPLISPSGTTNIEDINAAENGEAVYGNAEDITFMQLDKYADLRVAAEVLERESKLLQSAFLMTSSVTRQAERVTAEEIRLMAQELESNLGGVYSAMAAEFQMPLVLNVASQLQKRGVLPKFNEKLKKHIKPTVLTGSDALGRREELDRMMQAFNAINLVLGPGAVVPYLEPMGVIMDIFAKASVPTTGLLKTAEKMAQEQAAAQQQAQMQTLVEKGTAPMAKGLADNPEALQAAISQMGGQQ